MVSLIYLLQIEDMAPEVKLIEGVVCGHGIHNEKLILEVLTQGQEDEQAWTSTISATSALGQIVTTDSDDNWLFTLENNIIVYAVQVTDDAGNSSPLPEEHFQ